MIMMTMMMTQELHWVSTPVDVRSLWQQQDCKSRACGEKLTVVTMIRSWWWNGDADDSCQVFFSTLSCKGSPLHSNSLQLDRQPPRLFRSQSVTSPSPLQWWWWFPIPNQLHHQSRLPQIKVVKTGLSLLIVIMTTRLSQPQSSPYYH